jgi:hypothetical protein
MSIQSEAVEEIAIFVKGFTVDSLFDRPGKKPKFTTSYKQLHALLNWAIIFAGGDFTEEKFGDHPQEGISDISQAFALLTFSLYKPSRMMARSAIENIVRVIVADAGGDYKTKSVHALFDNAKALLADNLIELPIIHRMIALYGELCLTVHSGHQDHLALRIPFEKVFAYDDEQNTMTLEFLHRTATAMNQLLYSRFSQKLQAIPHKNRDFVLDSLPKTLKRNVHA